MPYAQINFADIQGRANPDGRPDHQPKYKISAIGCFITSFCNVLLDCGVDVSPAALNAIFRDRSIFVDVDDGILDDVGYSSITAAYPNLTVVETGAGTPGDGGMAIVKFAYKSPRTGNGTTHFCKYLGGGRILDSWDGKEKFIRDTYYGNPVGYAKYAYRQPEVVKPVSPYTGNTQASNTNRFRRLPGVLELQTKIDTSFWFTDFKSWGAVKAHSPAGRGTRFAAVGIYQHPLGGEYYMNAVDFDNADQDGTPLNWLGFNTVDMEPYTAPAPTPPPAPAAAAPVVTVVPAPAAPAKPADTVYTKLEQPLDLVTNKAPTNKWDLGFDNDTQATSVEQLAEGAEFKAYGKAQRTDDDRPCYFMSEADFGQADVTGIPTYNAGINTVDLSPKPAAPAAPVVDTAPTEVAQPTPAPATPVTPAPADDSTTVPVTIVNNPKAYQRSFKPFLGAVEYVALASTKVYDVENPNGEPQQLVKEGIYKIAGPFTTPDGIPSYRTITSVKNGTWFAIPKVCLESKKEADKDSFVDNMLEVADDIRREAGNFTRRERHVIKAANVDGFIGNLFKKKGVKK